MIISEKSFVGYGSVKKEHNKKQTEVPETKPLSQKEMKKRINFAQALHNNRASNIRDRFSHLSVFQSGGSLENLVAFK